jgi:hypothetical protein
MASALRTGPALSATGLLDLTRNISANVTEAGASARFALVSAFESFTFDDGKVLFAAARKLATKANGDTKSPDHTRLAEAHAVFTAIKLAGVKPETFGGWIPTVTACREALKDAKLTNAGNPRLDEAERESAKAIRAEREIKVAAADLIPDQGDKSDVEYAAEIKAALATARTKHAEESAVDTIPATLKRIGKALAKQRPGVLALIAAQNAKRAAWAALPEEVKLAIGELANLQDTLIAYASELKDAAQDLDAAALDDALAPDSQSQAAATSRLEELAEAVNSVSDMKPSSAKAKGKRRDAIAA